MKIPDQITNFISEKLTEKNRYYVLIGVLLSVFVFDYLFLMMPQVRILLSLTPKTNNLLKDLKQAHYDIDHIKQYQAQVAELQNKMLINGTKILAREEIPVILENITKIASETSIKLNQMMPVKESQVLVLTTDEGKYYSLSILLSGRGGYHNIGRFFTRLENDKIFMSVIDFDITSHNEDQMHHAVNATIKVFFREKIEGTAK